MSAALLSLAVLLSLVLLFGSLAIGLLRRLHRPAAASTCCCSRTRPTRCTASTTGCIAPWRVQQFADLQSAVRRQLLHRPLHEADRLEPEQGRADRLEFRHQPEARQSVPVRHRQRHDGVGRAVDDQRPDVELVVQAQQGEDRRPQLSRQQHPLSARRQDRHELPARHQGDDPDRRAGARERRPAGLALLRDPARGRARQAPQHGPGRRSPAAADCARRTSTTSSPWRCSCWATGAFLFVDAVRRPCGGAALSELRPRLAVRRRRLRLVRVDPVLRVRRAGEPRLQAAAAEGRLDLRPGLLVPRAALEVLRLAAAVAVQGHAVQER